MAVRRLGPAEWAAFRAIRLRALQDAPDAFGASYADELALSDADWRARADRADRAVFVADGPGGLVGLAIGGPAPNIADTAALYSMWVDPAARRQGLASALIAAVRAWAAAAGYPRLGLGVTTSNAPAIALYERLGFVDSGERHPLRDGEDLMIQIMVAPIGSPDPTAARAPGRAGPTA